MSTRSAILATALATTLALWIAAPQPAHGIRLDDVAHAPASTGAADCVEHIANGSFETGEFADWQTSGSPWLGEQAHHGLLSGALAGVNDADDAFYQTVTLPASVDTATLGFWWYMETTETGIGTPWDFLHVEALDSGGNLLQALETQNNLSPPDVWQYASIELSQYPDLLGLTLRISFRGTTDDSDPTTFFIDEVSLEVCEEVSTCPLDPHEPNDNFDNAAAIDLGISYYSLFICPADDVDWYRFDTAVDEEITIEMYNLPADYDLRLYDPAGGLVTESAGGGTANERIVHRAEMTGAYRAFVIGYNGAWSTEEYTLRVEVQAFEPPTPTATPTPTASATPTATARPTATATATATPRPTPSATSTPTPTATATSTSTTTPTPADTPVLTHTATSKPAATPTFTPTAMPTATSTSTSTSTSTATSTTTATATASPTATASSTPAPTATATCPPDTFEPNDTFVQAVPITRFVRTVLCPPGDVDWYSFLATQGQVFKIDLYDLPADFDLELYDPTNKRLDESSHSGDGDETIRFMASGSGEYRLRVFSGSGAFATTPYLLYLEQESLTRPDTFSDKRHTQPFDIAIDNWGGGVYWTELSGEQGSPPGGVYTNEYGGNINQPLTVVEASDLSPADLAANDGGIFFRDWQKSEIVSVAATPNAPVRIAMASGKDLVYSRGIEADKSYIYWGDELSLKRQHKTTLAVDELVRFGPGAGYSPVDALAADAVYLYWTDTLTSVDGVFPRIHRTPKDGSGATTSIVGPHQGAFQFVGVVRYTSGGKKDVFAASQNGIYAWRGGGASPPDMLYAPQAGATITGLTVDGNFVFWTESDGFSNALLYLPLAGGRPQVLANGLSNPRALVDSADQLYWSESDGLKFMRKPGAFNGVAPRVSVGHDPLRPAPGAAIQLSAEASDDDGIREIQVLVDGQVVRTCVASPCTASITAPSYAALLRYAAIATDFTGLSRRTPVKLLPIGNSGKDSDQDQLSDAWESVLCTSPTDPDSDRDQLLDGWEVLGQWFNDGTVLDLPSLGAHPCRPDVFVELDWHRGYPPDATYVQATINDFRAHGVELHVDTGQLGGGGEIPATHDTRHAAVARDPWSSAYRVWTFHYVLSSSICYTLPSGKVECRGGADTGSNITLRRARGANFGYVFMHELGHSIGLGHGGTSGRGRQRRNGDYVWYEYAWLGPNRMPNYFSMMNYAQSPLTFRVGSRYVRQLGFSEVALPPLNESALDERATSPFARALAAYPKVGPGRPVFVYYCKQHDPPYHVLTDGAAFVERYNYDTRKMEPGPSPALAGIDWDCDGLIERSVRADINNDTAITVLPGRADWPYLPLKTRCLNPSGYYSPAYAQKADNPPCEPPTPTPQPIRLAGAAPGQVGTPEPELVPEDDLLFGLPYENCDGTDTDGDGIVDNGCLDGDADGVPDVMDNCPFTANPDQADADLNWVGDACQDTPDAPAEVTAAFRDGDVVLRWAPSTNPELRGYVVTRAQAGAEPVFVHLGDYPSANRHAASFVDGTIRAAGEYRYRVQAVNRSWRESEPGQVTVSVEGGVRRPIYLPRAVVGRPAWME